MPLITERICGICPLSHHLTSAKACDAISGSSRRDRRNCCGSDAQWAKNDPGRMHAFFMLAGPDLILGRIHPRHSAMCRSFSGRPQLTLKAIRLRKFGQEIIERLGEPPRASQFRDPGGVTELLAVPTAMRCCPPWRDARFIKDGLSIIKGWADVHAEDMRRFAAFPSGLSRMVDENDAVQLYHGGLRLVDSERTELERFDGADYLDYIAEHVESWSYLKFPYIAGSAGQAALTGVAVGPPDAARAWLLRWPKRT